MRGFQHGQGVQRTHVVRMALVQALHQLLGRISITLDAQRTCGLQESIITVGIGDLDQGIEMFSGLVGLLVTQEQYRCQLPCRDRIRRQLDPATNRRQAAGVVLQMQRYACRPFRRIGIARQDGGVLIVVLRQPKLAAMGADLTDQVAVHQVFVEFPLDRFRFGKRQHDGALFTRRFDI